MPELPEVETTRRGIAPHIEGRRVNNVIVRNANLRYGVPSGLDKKLSGYKIEQVERRGKYLLLHAEPGALMLHLGMSGSLRYISDQSPPKKHDHVDVVFAKGCLRLHDPRRFGSVQWLPRGELDHPLLANVGPEPLSDVFNGAYLYQRSHGRKGPVKNYIMDSKIVAGVGNIYANEALFLAGILPQRSAGKVSLARYELLAKEIKSVLQAAIDSGGSTLRDFVNSDGQPGYFAFEHKVYGREGQPCVTCGATLKLKRIAQRATVYCSACQR